MRDSFFALFGDREVEEPLRLALESAAIGIWDFNPHSGVMVFQDNRCRAAFGLSPGAPIDYQRFISAVHVEDRERVHATVQRLIAVGGDCNLEYRTVGIEDGVERVVSVNGRSSISRRRGALHRRDPGYHGGTAGRRGAPERAEAAALTHEQLFRAIFDSLPELAWTARPDGFIDYYNPGWHNYTGTTFDEMKGWGWLSVVNPVRNPDIADTWRAVLAAGKSAEIDLSLRRHDGVYRWFLVRVNPICDHQGRVIRWVGINTDIDDRKRADAEREVLLARPRWPAAPRTSSWPSSATSCATRWRRS